MVETDTHPRYPPDQPRPLFVEFSNMKMIKHSANPALSAADISRVVEMAWEDRTAFEAIEIQFGLNESAVVALMRRTMKPSSFRMWRTRMAGRVTKHAVLRGATHLRHCASHTRQ